MRSSFIIEQRFDKASSNAESFEDFVDRVLDHAENIGVELDAAVNLKTLTASWVITVDSGGDELEMTQEALTALRTALHATSCHTASLDNVVGTVSVKTLETA